MAGISKSGGQRTNTNSASGRKERSATSVGHKGSRVEPSHETEKDRSETAKKAQRKAGVKKVARK